jgi:hypothetical protein
MQFVTREDVEEGRMKNLRRHAKAYHTHVDDFFHTGKLRQSAPARNS